MTLAKDRNRLCDLSHLLKCDRLRLLEDFEYGRGSEGGSPGGLVSVPGEVRTRSFSSCEAPLQRQPFPLKQLP